MQAGLVMYNFECQRDHAIGCGPRWNEKKKKKKLENDHSFNCLSFLPTGARELHAPTKRTFPPCWIVPLNCDPE